MPNLLLKTFDLSSETNERARSVFDQIFATYSSSVVSAVGLPMFTLSFIYVECTKYVN